MKTQAERILDALKEPMTINELYSALPDITPAVIAPLVTKMKSDEMVFVVGEKRSKTASGVNRMQKVWSSRPEDKPEDKMGDAFTVLYQVFNIKAPEVPPCCVANMRTHICKDDE